ncbi:MAG TPA: hypothetical protein VJN93_13225 [Candidatus Acidoferrum sp.]|nr:hypothetical protein [Candidatus Acidoferrum sp.]
MSRETSAPGDVIRFWITIENKTDRPVEKISVEHMDVPGFRLVRRCWGAGLADPGCYAAMEAVATQAPECAAKDRQLPPSEVCELLPPKQTVTIWGDVRFTAAVPHGTDFAVVRWTSGTATSSAVVILGPVEAYGRIRSIWEAVTTEWQIGIPVWITILSGLYALWKSWRERRAQRHATEFEQKRRTWNLLLLKVDRLAFRHYMPIVSTVQGLLMYFRRLQSNEGPREENSLGAFCYILRFHWRIRKMKRSGASWYFKDLTAEELVVAMVQTHRRSLGLSDLRQQAALDEFLENIAEETTVADMLRSLETMSAAQERFLAHFREWAGGVEQRHEADLLGAITKIITYETNRPYLYWYGELRRLDLTVEELRKIREVAAASEGTQKGIQLRIEKYLAAAGRDKRIDD